jgi:hypothetical protein
MSLYPSNMKQENQEIVRLVVRSTISIETQEGIFTPFPTIKDN